MSYSSSPKTKSLLPNMIPSLLNSKNLVHGLVTLTESFSQLKSALHEPSLLYSKAEVHFNNDTLVINSMTSVALRNVIFEHRSAPECPIS